MEIPAEADVFECMESDDEIGCGKPKYEEFIESREMAKPHICLGILFASVDAFRRVVREVNISMGKDLIWSKNDLDRIVVVCNKERCKYKVYTSNVKGEKSIQIKQMYLKHSCARSYQNTQVTSQWLANKYLAIIRVNPQWLLNAFKHQVMNDFKVGVH